MSTLAITAYVTCNEGFSHSPGIQNRFSQDCGVCVNYTEKPIERHRSWIPVY